MSLVNLQTGSTPKPREQLDKPKNSSELSEMKAIMQEQQQTIAEMSSKNSTMLSQNQELTSRLMTAQKEIELLTSRAASVNSTELKNKELLNEANQATKLADKALQESQQERAKAERTAQNAKNEREAAQKEMQKRREAEEKAKKAESTANGTKLTFRSLFIGNVIFAAALAFFQLYDHRNILAECGQWFVGFSKGIIGFVWLVISLYMGAVHGMESWKWNVPLCFILSGIVFIFIGGVLLVLFRLLFIKIGDVLHNISCEYDDGLFKAAVSADIALILFFICLWFYTPIKAALPLNIFSSWLILSAVGVLIWNAPEIVRGVKNG